MGIGKKTRKGVGVGATAFALSLYVGAPHAVADDADDAGDGNGYVSVAGSDTSSRSQRAPRNEAGADRPHRTAADHRPPTSTRPGRVPAAADRSGAPTVDLPAPRREDEADGGLRSTQAPEPAAAQRTSEANAPSQSIKAPWAARLPVRNTAPAGPAASAGAAVSEPESPSSPTALTASAGSASATPPAATLCDAACWEFGTAVPTTPREFLATATVRVAQLFDRVDGWLAGLPAGPIVDFVSGALLLVRRTLALPTVPTVTVGNVTLVEGNPGADPRQAVFTVTLDRAYSTPVSVGYATTSRADAGAPSTAVATAGTDYRELTGQLSFAPGETAKQVTVSVGGDSAEESTEAFGLGIFATLPGQTPTARMTGVVLAAATGTIRSDDLPGCVARKNCANTDLSQISLPGADLSGVNFSGANLTNADLRSAALTGATFRYADLGSANLTGANLVGANLLGANMSGTVLLYADLSGADLTNANLTNATIKDPYRYGSDANLAQATLTEAVLPRTGSFAIQTTAAVPGNWKTAAISPDNSRVYLAGNNSVAVLDTGSASVIATIPVRGASQIAVTATRVYVTGDTGVTVIDTGSNTVSATINIAGNAVAVLPDGSRLYVANRDASSVTVIDAATNQVITTLSGEDAFQEPVGLAVSPDGKYLWALAETGNLARVRVDNGNNTLWNSAASEDYSVYPGMRTASQVVAVSPDSSRVFVAISREVATATFPAVQALIPVPTGPGDSYRVDPDGLTTKGSSLPQTTQALAMSPDGRALYMTWGESQFAVIDVTSSSGGKVLDVPALNGSTIVPSRDGSRIYVPANNAVTVIQTPAINLAGFNLGGADLSGLNLAGADLTRANLAGADLTGANLIGANLAGADLTGSTGVLTAQIGGANFSGVKGIDFSGADLSGKDLAGSTFTGVSFAGAKLTDTVLTGATLKASDLSGADLSGKNLTKADFTGANLAGANLAGADVTGAVLSGAELSGVDLSRVDLSNRDFTGTNFSGATMRETNFSGAKLDGADLSDTLLARANLDRAQLAGANLGGANAELATLTNADLSNADLRGANLFSANLLEAKLAGATLTDATLDRATLTEATLTGAELSGASLRAAGLQRADLSGADLTGADLALADLRNATLSGATLTGSTGLASASLSGASFARARGVDLSGADLTGRDFTGTNFAGVNLSAANLTGATVTGTVLTGANLAKTVLAGLNLSDTDLTATTLAGANLTGANLSGALLPNADLSGATLRDAVLTGAQLPRAALTNTVLSGAKLDGAKLTGATLSGAIAELASLRNADLSNANLNGSYLGASDLTNAQLVGATMTDARMDNSVFTGANLSYTDLTAASLRRVTFSRANLIFANLTNADFSFSFTITDATLTGARWQNTTCPDGTSTDTGCSGRSATPPAAASIVPGAPRPITLGTKVTASHGS